MGNPKIFVDVQSCFIFRLVNSSEVVLSEQSLFMFVRIYGNWLDCLTSDMEAGTVLPLGPLDADASLRHSGTLYAVVSGP